MGTVIALLRGINVGGRNRLPMQALVRDLEALGLEDVRTYIQSGNAVFRSRRAPSAKLRGDIADAIERRHGFRPLVMLLPATALLRAVAANPFPDAEAEPASLHLLFLEAEPASPDMSGLRALAAPSERVELRGAVLYLHAPDGIARSRLAAAAERRLGVAATARNWRTVQKLLDLAEAG